MSLPAIFTEASLLCEVPAYAGGIDEVHLALAPRIAGVHLASPAVDQLRFLDSSLATASASIICLARAVRDVRVLAATALDVLVIGEIGTGKELIALALTRYEWPGNVRELQGVIRGAGQLAEREVITASDLLMLEVALSPDRSRKAELGEQCEKAMDLDRSEARPVLGQIYAHRALMQADGNQTKAAKQAGMSRSAFRDLMRRPSEGSGRD